MKSIAQEAREARAEGRTYFHSTEPHVCGKRLRYTNGGACVECTRQKRVAHHEKLKRRALTSKYLSVKERQQQETYEIFMGME